jgi:iron complex outermembrane receptor protein
MRRSLRLALLALSTTALAPLGAQAAYAAAPAATGTAAPAAASETVTVEDIVVTARRRDERLIDAPVAITAVSGKRLEAYNVTNFTDIANLVPSLVAGRAASGSSASIFLRGVGSTALSAGFDLSVSFVIDGLPMSRGREINLSQYDVQHVEVLKGPQALFYGKNTTGGLISVVTNGPTDSFEAGIKAGYGFEAEEKYAEGYVSGPLSDTFKARAAFRISDSNGAFKNNAAETYLDPLHMERHRLSDHRGFGKTASGRLTLEWEPTSNLDLQLKVGATRQKDGGPTDLLERICGGGRTVPFTANGIPPSPNADCRINGASDSSSLPVAVAQANYRYAKDGDLYADLKSKFAILTSKASFDKVDVTSITSYYTFKQTDLNNVSGEAYPASFSQLADFRQTAEEVRFQTKFEGAFNMMVGVFVSDQRFTFNTDAYIFPVPLDPSSGTFVTFKRDNGFDGNTYSAFAEGTYNFAEKWELSAGARWSREERDSFQRALPAHVAFAAAFPANIALADKFKDENVSPQVTLRYKPSRDTSFYAAYKQGFKSGGFNISQSLTPAASVAAGRFGSETAKGEEAGVRSILMGGSLSLNATIYNYEYSDLQVQNFDPVTIGQVVANAGKLKTRGVEGDFEWLVESVPGLSFRGAAAYNDAKYSDYVGQCYGGQTIAAGCALLRNPLSGAFTSQDYGGRTPPKAPKFAGRVGASYEFAVSGEVRGQLTGDVSHTSRYNFTDTLRPDGVQPGYTKLDAAVRILGPGERWRVSLIGRNLTNKRVVTAANDIPFTGGTGTGTSTGVLADMSAFVENPREVYLEFALKF